MPKIQSLAVFDTYGTKEFKASKFTVLRLRGKNGSGKSSVLKALAYVFSGGTSPECIRKGAEKSVIEMELDDGVRIVKITRPKKNRSGEITGYVSDLEVTQPDGTPRNAPKAYIDELSEALAVDPSILLRIDASTVPGRRQLAAELMRLVPIFFNSDEIKTAIAKRPGKLAPDPEAYTADLPEVVDLDGHKKLVTAITEERRRIGIIKDQAAAAAERMKRTLPPENGQDHSERLAALEKEALEIERAISDRKVEIEGHKGAAMLQAEKQFSEAESIATAEYNRAVQEAQKVRDAAKDKALAELNRQREEVLKVIAEWLNDLDKEAKPEQDRVSTAIGEVKEQIRNNARAIGIREEIRTNEEAAHQSAVKYDRLSEVLQNLESLRMDKLSNLPVDGLIVEGGEVYLDGILWHAVNLSRRVMAVIQICTQRSGRLPFIICDDFEHCDAEMRNAIERGLSEAGYQIIEAIVSDGPLSIEVAEVAA